MFGTPELTSFKRGGWNRPPTRTVTPDLLLTTWVSGLHRGNLLIRDRNGRTAMPLFAHEIEFRRGRMTVQTGLLQRRIDHFIPTVLNRRPLGGYVQCKKLPSVGLRKGGSIMLDHRLGGDQLQNCACGIFFIGHTVPKNPDGFFELLGVGVLNPRVSHLRQVEHAAEGLFGDHDLISRQSYGRIETQNQTNDVAHSFSLLIYGSDIESWAEKGARQP